MLEQYGEERSVFDSSDIGVERRAVARDVATATADGGPFFFDDRPAASARVLEFIDAHVAPASLAPLRQEREP